MTDLISIRTLRTIAVCCSASLVSISGCSDGYTGPKCFPVRGTVLYNNAPLAEAVITFHPLDSTAPDFQNPLGISDGEGHFQLTTVRVHDGAPPGKYAVTVELRQLRADGDEMLRDGANLLPEKYRDRKTSGLEFAVLEEDNEVPPLELKGAPIASPKK